MTPSEMGKQSRAARPAGRTLAWGLGLAAIFLAGCGGSLQKLSGVDQMGFAQAPTPPALLTGTAGFLLTNSAGFSAKVVVDLPGVVSQTRRLAGTLLGREDRLLFAGDKDNSFIWSVTDQTGFLVNEPLQGYAPLRAALAVSNIVITAESANAESINGHPCRKTEMSVHLADGATDQLTVWRATDLGNVPLRIVSATGPNRFTANFSNVRLEKPSRELFEPPKEFSKYANAEALMTELVGRRAATSDKYRNAGRNSDDLPPDSRSNGYQPRSQP